jgi:hypothetical protein
MAHDLAVGPFQQLIIERCGPGGSFQVFAISLRVRRSGLRALCYLDAEGKAFPRLPSGERACPETGMHFLDSTGDLFAGTPNMGAASLEVKPAQLARSG